jgi:hypothetical protein
LELVFGEFVRDKNRNDEQFKNGKTITIGVRPADADPEQRVNQREGFNLRPAISEPEILKPLGDPGDPWDICHLGLLIDWQ